MQDKSEIIASRQRNVEVESQGLQMAQAIELEQQKVLRAAQQAQKDAADEMRDLHEKIKKFVSQLCL